MAWIVQLWMHAECHVHPVCYEYEEKFEAVACGCCQLLPVHHEAAVPGEADDGAFGSDDLGRHRCGHAVAHGTAGGCQLSVQSGVAMEPMNPYGKSEEHTSELQSLMRISYAVFCLQKKNI